MINFPKIIVERLVGAGGGLTDLVKKGDMPFSPNIPPPQPPDGVSETFEFSTFNNISQTGSIPFLIGIISESPDWTLSDGATGELLANAIGFAVDGIMINKDNASGRTAYTVISNQSGDGGRKYIIRGTASMVVLGNLEKPVIKQTYDAVTVHKYSNKISQYTFSLSNILLTIPANLPRHITDTSQMFRGSNLFNQDIGNWDTSRITNMFGMFDGNSSFNRDISRWNVKNVSDMGSMFWNASKFNQDLSPWCVSKIPSAPLDFSGGANDWVKSKPNWGTCPGDTVEPPYKPPVEEDVDDDTVIKAFDYAVLRYRWLPSGGSDFDTRTYITTPSRVNRKVGWSRLKNDAEYLIWNEDNTGVGVESVLINIDKIRTAYPSETHIDINMDGFWYAEIASGNLVLEFATYRGGQMSVSGYDWVNTGGLAIQILKLAAHTLVAKSDDIEGENLATLSYDTLLNSGTFTARPTPSVPLPVEPPDGGGPVEPPVGDPDMPPEAEPMNFTVSSLDTYGGSLVFHIDLFEPQTGWSVYIDGVLVANDSLENINYISKEIKSGYTRISLKNMQGSTKDIKVHGRAKAIRLTHLGWGGIAVPSRTVDVVSFGTRVRNFNLNLGQCHLTVPNTLPTWVNDLTDMFAGARQFNQDIGDWDVSHVTKMRAMLASCDDFNQDISRWDVSNVANMTDMFQDALSFNQDLSGWCVSLIPAEPTSFAHNTSAWILPKPVWGTCPAPVIDIPEDGLLIELTKLRPSYYSQAVSDVYLSRDSTEPWQLHNATTGELLCDQDGVYNLDVIQDKGEPYTTYIKLTVNEPLTVLLSGVDMGGLKIMVDAAEAYSSDMTVYGRVKVIKYPTTVRYVKHRIYGYELTVPSALPTNMVDLSECFYESNLFNQDISSWDVSQTINMAYMFASCTRFNQDLFGWNVANYPLEPSNFAYNASSWTLPKPLWGSFGSV